MTFFAGFKLINLFNLFININGVTLDRVLSIII